MPVGKSTILPQATIPVTLGNAAITSNIVDIPPGNSIITEDSLFFITEDSDYIIQG